MLFSREMPLVNPTAPGSTFIIRSIVSHLLANFWRRCTFLSFIYLSIYQSIIYHLISLLDRREIDNLSFALGAKVCVLCVGDVYMVLLVSPTGLITLVS